MGPPEKGTFPGCKFGFFAYYCWAVGLLTLILKFTR